MTRKRPHYRHMIWLESRRSQVFMAAPEAPPQHEPIPKRNPDLPPTTIPQPDQPPAPPPPTIVPHPSEPTPPTSIPDPGPAPITMQEQFGCLWPETVPAFARRQASAQPMGRWLVHHVRRLRPHKDSGFRLRYRNLKYKRKWALGWI